MKSICLYFQIHQPFRFRTYRFFDIGHDHYYYDDFLNRSVVQKISKKCYLPANLILLDVIKKYKGKFKVAFSISGSTLEQFELYSPETLKSFQELAATGCVEFLAETYSHALVSLKDQDEFVEQVRLHVSKIEKLFGQRPRVFRNTELAYSDKIGETVYNMGFKAMLSEGAKHILGWKSPNYLYCNATFPRLKLLLRNYKLSDDIAFHFSDQSWSEWPLTAQKFSKWMHALDEKEDVVNLFMDYETFGEHQWEGSGIFEFLRAFPEEILKEKRFAFHTPTEVAEKYEPVAVLHVKHPVSWADEERDMTAWLGNNLQWEAFENLYALREHIAYIDDESILKDWQRLQNSDHFYFMCTKYFSDGAVHRTLNPFKSPYDAFINYMNVLADFGERVKKAPKSSVPKEYNTFVVESPADSDARSLKQSPSTKNECEAGDDHQVEPPQKTGTMSPEKPVKKPRAKKG